MSHKDRNLYLSNIELEEAKNMFLEELGYGSKLLYKEEVKVIDSLGRITIRPVFAKLSSPYYNASAMDGVAVISSTTHGADESSPLRIKLNKDFIYVDTGDLIKDPYDSVIMIEDIVEIDDETIEIIKAATPWQHVRPVGEDIVASEMIVPSFHRVRPVDIGALLSGGIVEIEVVRKPRIGIIPTGTEIIEPGDNIQPGKIIESNSRMFEALVKEYGGIPKRYNTIKDDYELIKEGIKAAIKENDILVVNAGSSAGTEDFTSHIIRELGSVIVHGVAIKPGKPAILGKVEDKPIVGIPGYPVSAYFVFEAFVKPLIYKALNMKEPKGITTEAILSKRMVSSLKHKEYTRIKLGRVDDKLIATPLNRGAGVTMSLVKADGIAIIPKNTEGIEAGENIEVELLRSLEDIENTIVSIGSHDILMDILANIIHENNATTSLSSAHVGSIGGVMAIGRGEAHIAPIHLLDEESGEYNISYTKKILRNKNIALIKGIKRIQGMIIEKGNPKGIKGLEDLLREDIIFVNRQKGSGTRILLDYKLNEKNLDSKRIKGYERDMTTHMTVASAVLSKTADVGIGIQSAANVMGLDFIPIGEEEYDFIIEERFLEEENIKIFINVLKSEEFKEKILEIGGYILENPGEILSI